MMQIGRITGPSGKRKERLRSVYSSISFVSMGSRIELSEMLDVPCVLYRNTLLHLQPCYARPGNVHNPERAFPHG